RLAEVAYPNTALDRPGVTVLGIVKAWSAPGRPANVITLCGGAGWCMTALAAQVMPNTRRNGMNLMDYLSKRGKLPKGAGTEWLTLCTLDVTTGALWAGDPHLANADDGHVTKVPAGRYVVEGMGRSQGRDRVVSRLRVRLAREKNPTVGKELGDTGTDSAMIGV